jgi:hypothetical protein
MSESVRYIVRLRGVIGNGRQCAKTVRMGGIVGGKHRVGRIWHRFEVLSCFEYYRGADSKDRSQGESRIEYRPEDSKSW